MQLLKTRKYVPGEKKRKHPTVKHNERDAKRDKRTDTTVKDKERHAKREKRKDPSVKITEAASQAQNRQSKKPKDFTALIKMFHEKIKQGPVYICTSCKQLMYRHSVVQSTSISSKGPVTLKVQSVIDKCLTNTKDIHGKEWICKTCLNYIKKAKIPPSSVANKMAFPDQGPLKYLNPLELTLLSPLLPFMKIHQAPRGQQYRLHGNMVVVPADIKNTVASLPRLPNESATIKALLKRRLRYEHHVYSLNIRPELIRRAAKYLSDTAELYKSMNINYNLNWNEEIIAENENQTNHIITENIQNHEQIEKTVQINC